MWLTTSILAWTRGGSPTLSPGTDAGRVCPKALHDAEPTKHTQPFPWKGVFGKDAEIRTRRALHEAKPSECPKGDRDCKRAPFYKNRLLLIVVNLTTTSFFGIFPD